MSLVGATIICWMSRSQNTLACLFRVLRIASQLMNEVAIYERESLPLLFHPRQPQARKRFQPQRPFVHLQGVEAYVLRRTV